MLLEKRLEQYTIKHPEEVLIVLIEVENDQDKIIIFKGFSSSLMGHTPADPDISIIPENAKIISIDRVKSPYNPNNPVYIQQNLSLENFTSHQEI
ncbi:MAG TPA: hypothetical protein V6C58_14430 [Allocoleopsis sp.]